MMRLPVLAALLAFTTLSSAGVQTESVAQLATDLDHASAKNADVVDHAAQSGVIGGGGSANVYCQATPNSFGTTAHIGYSGSLVLADGTFGLTVTGVTPVASAFGMFTYGRVPYNVPFGNGYLCISPFSEGIYRMSPQSLADGSVARSMLDAPGEFAMFQPGESWNFQFWYRNPQALAQGAPTTFNLSDALHVDFAPSL